MEKKVNEIQFIKNKMDLKNEKSSTLPSAKHDIISSMVEVSTKLIVRRITFPIHCTRLQNILAQAKHARILLKI